MEVYNQKNIKTTIGTGAATTTILGTTAPTPDVNCNNSGVQFEAFSKNPSNHQLCRDTRTSTQPINTNVRNYWKYHR
ncbi:hypothetical protein OCU04_001877 [Sclerotinia nivalis]|uniref:Uncharacterized protein n=1 Tax=Sclerotinia nivalis TaxID=352851 RepID=A0A9X0B0T6_9HELO|nr:hypothetical protein OCU04_001877 [Sclerotinia nivalis]